ncbi:hypothetical protein TrVGV298_009511 [Trichoderma virens]|nr:hypothetical protein TrVGV298_009511 [Trichoderma virens]
MIETEGGISGSPVWVGYKSQPTVVAIHNYGPKIKNSHYGSKGTRINLKCLRNIFDWTGVDMTPKLLRAIDPESKLVVPSLRLIYWAQDSAFRVIVDEVDEPAETMLISVFPVYAGPTGANHIKSGYGFMQTRPDGWLRWLSWNPPPASTVSLVNDIRKAWLGRPEGKQWDSGEPFAIVTPLWPTSVSEQRKEYMLVIDLAEIIKKAKWRLEEPGEILNLIAYQPFRSNQKKIKMDPGELPN